MGFDFPNFNPICNWSVTKRFNPYDLFLDGDFIITYTSTFLRACLPK